MRTPKEILEALKKGQAENLYNLSYEDVANPACKTIIHECITDLRPDILSRVRYGVYKLCDGTMICVNDIK